MAAIQAAKVLLFLIVGVSHQGWKVHGVWKEQKGNNAFVLVVSKELILDSAAFDVLEPCERFSVERLCQTIEMLSLFK